MQTSQYDTRKKTHSKLRNSTNNVNTRLDLMFFSGNVTPKAIIFSSRLSTFLRVPRATDDGKSPKEGRHNAKHLDKALAGQQEHRQEKHNTSHVYVWSVVDEHVSTIVCTCVYMRASMQNICVPVCVDMCRCVHACLCPNDVDACAGAPARMRVMSCVMVWGW